MRDLADSAGEQVQLVNGEAGDRADLVGNGEVGVMQHIDIDDRVFPLYANPNTSTSGALTWGVGLNWHLNKNFKVNFNYEKTDFDGGTSALLEHGEQVVLTRAQISF